MFGVKMVSVNFIAETISAVLSTGEAVKAT